METLNELSKTLPTIQSHVSDIRVVYDSGREKVCSDSQLTEFSFSSHPSGANPRLRFDLAEYRILRTLAKDNFHFHKPSLLALEGLYAFPFHYFIPHLCTPFLDCVDWRIPSPSTSTSVGRKVDVLDYRFCFPSILRYD